MYNVPIASGYSCDLTRSRRLSATHSLSVHNIHYNIKPRLIKMFLRIFLLCALLTIVASKSVIVGQVSDYNGIVRKVFEKPVSSAAIPFFKREQEIYFEYPVGDQKIKGIVIRDLDNGLAEPSINRGGIGFPFANIKLISERGSGLNYQIEIYA
ncbi:uncharacterized protein LOC123664683 [Melitaea cinxia]|uniref:uncharacterized protein LOC123664683 n=1 Tax=Melitaea cinxia TaxID=113334 RepID=UPI001E271B50|nr:uncharacterized protein LOC123664683 [Melitaea cinxia]